MKTFKPSDTSFVRRLLAAIAIIGLALILWQLRKVLLLLFAGVVIGTMLNGLTVPIARLTGVARKWSLLISIFVVFLVTILVGWFAGSEIASEFSNLTTRLPQAWQSFRARTESYMLGEYLLSGMDKLESDSESIIIRLSTVAVSIVNSITDLILILVGGLYFALDPQLYYDGILHLIPKSARARAAEALDSTAVALKKWLRAKLAEMVIVGTLTTIGLLLIDFPSALALGLVAGIAEFVPYIGLLIAVVPALLIALTLEPEMLAWTILVYTVVQQLEGNAIMPLIEQKMVYTPPVLTIFSIVVFGLLFGPLGLLFAAPLTVVLVALIKKLYVEGVLGDSGENPRIA